MIDKIPNFEENEELDFKNLFSLFWRRKKIILITLVSLTTFSFFYGNYQKKVWEGGFQIVLSNDDDDDLKLRLRGGANKLKTELKTLESPSVLIPVYDFVKDFKNNKGEDTSSLTFRLWKQSNLKVELIKDTSILKVTYKEKDKESILPVLNLISSEYQAYTGRKKSKDLKNIIKYLEEQIIIYKKKNIDSYNIASEFAEQNNLAPLEIISDEFSDYVYKDPSTIEEERLEIIDQINTYRSQLRTLNDFDNSIESLLYISLQVSDSELKTMWDYLDNVNTNLVKLRSIFYEDDPVVLKTYREKELLMEDIKRQTVNIIKGKILFLENRLSSIERPKGVFTKYRELIGIANQNNLTYKNFKDQLSEISLELAQDSQPWELISDPTVLDYPIAPRKLRIQAIGILAGLFFGSIFAFIFESYTGILYGLNSLRRFIPHKLICKLSINEEKTLDRDLELLFDSKFMQNKEPIILFALSKTIIEKNLNFIRKLEEYSKVRGKKIILSSDLLENKEYKNKILLAQSGEINKINLKNILEKFDLQNNEIIGWIFLEN